MIVIVIFIVMINIYNLILSNQVNFIGIWIKMAVYEVANSCKVELTLEKLLLFVVVHNNITTVNRRPNQTLCFDAYVAFERF